MGVMKRMRVPYMANKSRMFVFFSFMAIQGKWNLEDSVRPRYN